MYQKEKIQTASWLEFVLVGTQHGGPVGWKIMKDENRMVLFKYLLRHNKYLVQRNLSKLLKRDTQKYPLYLDSVIQPTELSQ